MPLLALFQDNFLQMALWAVLLASVASGTIGPLVVVKRIAFIAGSISHSVLAGIGLALWLKQKWGISWADPLLGAFCAAIGSALLIGWIHLNYRQREDAAIAALWSTGMAIGVIFLSLTPGTNAELMHVLFGNILWTTRSDLLLLGSLDILLLVSVAYCYRPFLALCVDEEQALLRAVPVRRLYLFLLTLVGLSIVLLIQVIGAILVLALLTLPATIAALFATRLSTMMGLTTVLCALLGLTGLAASYALDWPPGATIALLAALLYFFLLPLRKKKLNWG